MKLELSGCVTVLAPLAVSPAMAITFYEYNVDFTIGTGPGSAEITGSIQTNCDACELNAANFVTSWSFRAPDGSRINSSEPSAAITISVPGPTNLLQATPTGISTLADATSGGFFLFCGDASDCLTISNVFFTVRRNQCPSFTSNGLREGHQFIGSTRPMTDRHLLSSSQH
jgi:hypothetical protein